MQNSTIPEYLWCWLPLDGEQSGNNAVHITVATFKDTLIPTVLTEY